MEIPPPVRNARGPVVELNSNARRNERSVRFGFKRRGLVPDGRADEAFPVSPNALKNPDQRPRSLLIHSPQLFQLGFELLLGLRVHAVNEEDALKVIRFMLNGASEQAAAAKFKALTILTERDDIHRFRPGDVGIYFREAQTPFRAGHRWCRRDDFRVHQHERHERADVGWLAL